MHNLLHDSILATICYGDIFEYPLTKEEVWKYLISINSDSRMQNSEFNEELERLVDNKGISKVGEYYCLHGREKIVEIRNKRKELSDASFKKAEWVSKILSWIPTVLFIGVSGSLAMENIDMTGDIDLFFITSPNTMWVTRLFVLLILELLGIRRKRIDLAKKGVVCANMFIDTTTFTFAQNKQNLYTAHETVQLKTIMSKNDTYTKFIRSNSWIRKYVPNAFEILRGKGKELHSEKNGTWIFLLQVVEPIARFLQFQYMKKHITTETITNTVLAFHPVDYEKITLKEYKKRLQKYKIGL